MKTDWEDKSNNEILLEIKKLGYEVKHSLLNKLNSK